MPEHHEDSWFETWEAIVSEVHKTDIPIECIKKIIFKLYRGKQQSINIHTLRRQGLEYDDIQEILTRRFEELDEDIRDVDFIVDISAVARIVQPETDRLLGKL